MHYLKQAEPQPEAATQEIRDVVSEILLDVEREGWSAVRRWSERLDSWSPEQFRVSAAEIRAAEAAVDDELREHLEFALEQVRGFARLQRTSLLDVEQETLPGVVLGHRHVPINAVG